MPTPTNAGYRFRTAAPPAPDACFPAYSALPARFLRRCRRDTVVHTSDAGKIISPLPTATPAWAVVAVGVLVVLPLKPPLPPPPPVSVGVGFCPKQFGSLFGSHVLVGVGFCPKQFGSLFGSHVLVGFGFCPKQFGSLFGSQVFPGFGLLPLQSWFPNESCWQFC